MSPDFLVIGAGVAGLRAAIDLAAAGKVLVVAKDHLRESASEYAQGGIAVALSDDDEVELHEQDTLAAGDGLCDRQAVRVLVEEGPAAIEELIQWGMEFDREGGKLAFTREGAHSRNRVLHAGGDSTGREMARTLYHKAASLKNVEFQSFRAITDLLVREGEVYGACVLDGSTNRILRVEARAVLLATGGLGRIFLETTNPDVATGDGVAMAFRVGARISDLEFVQFHPTALHREGAPRFLLSEALRGEGARLLNQAGERFTDELAPRDVVSRAIVAEMKRTGAPHVFLDLSHRGEEFVQARFPRVYSTCLQYGVNLGREPAPVHPAAHYAMGGVRTDLDGATNLKRLFAAGEAACTGVHGANRLASNSLLEGLVYGARAGRAMRECTGEPKAAIPHLEWSYPIMPEPQLRQLAWDACGISRHREALARACLQLESVAMQKTARPTLEELECRNIHQVLLLIASGALAREESRGGHFRCDFPSKRPEFEKHSVMERGLGVRFE